MKRKFTELKRRLQAGYYDYHVLTLLIGVLAVITVTKANGE